MKLRVRVLITLTAATLLLTAAPVTAGHAVITE